MAKKQDNSLKIANQKAQYLSILSNIRIANTELEVAIEKRNKSKTGLTKLIEKQKTTSEEVHQLLQLRDSTFQELDRKKAKLETDVLEFNTYKKVIDKDIEKKLATLEKITNRKNHILSDTNDKIEKKEVEFKNLTVKADLLNEAFEIKTDALKEVSKDYNEINSALAELIQEMDRQGNALDKELNKTTSFIEDLKEELDHTRNQKAAFIANLEEREKKLIVREADSAVIIRRLKELYKEHYPNRELKI